MSTLIKLLTAIKENDKTSVDTHIDSLSVPFDSERDFYDFACIFEALTQADKGLMTAEQLDMLKTRFIELIRQQKTNPDWPSEIVYRPTANMDSALYILVEAFYLAKEHCLVSALAEVWLEVLAEQYTKGTKRVIVSELAKQDSDDKQSALRLLLVAI